MKKSTLIKSLCDRVDTLEREFESFLSLLQSTKTERDASLSYEEVIDLWLNGKMSI